MSPCFHPQPLFTMSAQQPSIVPFTQEAYEELSRQFDPHPVSSPHIASAWQRRDGFGGRGKGMAWPQPTEVLSRAQLAMQFISQYSPEDIVTAQIEGSSGALWRISPPSRAQMKRELYNGTADITLRFTWNFQRYVCPGLGWGLDGRHASVGHIAPLLAGTWPREALWSTPTRSTPWTWPPTALSGGSWPTCWRAPRTSQCEWRPKGWGAPGRLGQT